MKLGLECPTAMLEMIQPLGDFDFILGHKVLEDDGYAEFYQNSDRFKILDNGVNEAGEPLSEQDLDKAMKMVDGNLIVAPDWMGDAKRTIESYIEFTKAHGRERVIGVLQASNFGEAFECLSAFGGGGVIAVPYDICSSREDSPLLMGIRRALIVCNIPNTTKVHLLGFTSLDEFFWYENRPNVVSIDTGIPVLLGLNSVDILDPLESKESPTLDLMEKVELTPQGWTGVCRNIAILRKFMA